MQHLGTDLSVLVGAAAHDAEVRDLQRNPVSGVRARSFQETRFDLAVVTGRENLAQALILRLLTPRGSLAALGHAEYGSRLHTLIGRLKTESIRHLCRAFVLECIAQEPRVEPKAVSFDFDLQAETPSSIAFQVAVRPVQGGDPITLGLEVGL